MRSLLALMVVMALMTAAIGCQHTGESIDVEDCQSCTSCACDVPVQGLNPTSQILDAMPKMQEPPLKQF